MSFTAYGYSRSVQNRNGTAGAGDDFKYTPENHANFDENVRITPEERSPRFSSRSISPAQNGYLTGAACARPGRSVPPAEGGRVTYYTISTPALGIRRECVPELSALCSGRSR